jgi:hypothetical protein
MFSKTGTDIGLLKTAARRLIQECGGIEGAATASRVAKSQLARYQDPDDVACFMPFDVAADLERACGQPFVTRAMAMAAGGCFIRPARGVAAVKASDLAAQLAKFGSEVGDVFSAAPGVLAPGVKAEQCAKLKRECEDAIAVLLTMRDALDTGETADGRGA